MVFAPVYGGGLTQQTAEWRRNHLDGFALGVFRIGDVVEEVALEDLRATNLEVVVEDRTAGEVAVLYDSRGDGPSTQRDDVWWTTDISVGGRVWGLSFIPTAAYLKAQPTWYSWLVLVGGLSFTGLIGMILLMMSGRTARVARLVEERTTELTQVNEELTAEISERRRIEQELIASKQFAERADRAKSEFLTNMSHELRTPLNAIIGYSEMLREEADDSGFASMSDDLGKIRVSAHHLLELINDVLDLSKIEAGRMELSPVTFDVEALIDEVVATVRPLVDKNDNQLTLDVQVGMRNIHADQTKLRQILYNLLSNAAKFTETGTIRLRTRQLQKDNGAWLEILIEDSGIGMSGEQLERAFDAFSQADASTTRRYGGTGLGLPITRRFCELMGGDVEATSELDKGSSFTVRLPFVPAPAPA